MVAADDSVTVGSILSRTIETVSASSTAVAVYLAVFVTGGSVSEFLATLDTTEFVIASGVLQIVFGLGSIVGGYLLMEAMLKRTGLFSYAGPRRFLAYLGQGILIGLGAALGLILFIVPGIILVVRWLLAAPLLVGTGGGAVESIEKSWRLTRGYGWRIFIACIPFGLLLIVAGAASAMVSEGEGLVSIIILSFATELLSVLVTGLSVALFGLIAPQTGEIGEVFA